MDYSPIIMWLGFGMAAYSVAGNDVIQTLGTFLTSNEEKVSWQLLWLYVAGILTVVLTLGWFDPFNWYEYERGVSYGRLDEFEIPIVYSWYHIIPPLVLMIITRTGIPTSTTFMILTLFSLEKLPESVLEMAFSVVNTDTILGSMLLKSIIGYGLAFLFALVVFIVITRFTEKFFIENPLPQKQRAIWATLQWFITGFLWWQWLTQDLANIYIYLRGGDNQPPVVFLASLFLILALLAYIFSRRGGAVQEIVRQKINTFDIRSATFIDLIYGLALYAFKYDYFGLWGAKIPMSTTWLFVGLLAGREIGIRINIEGKLTKNITQMVIKDFLKILLGLVISIVLVFIIKILADYQSAN